MKIKRKSYIPNINTKQNMGNKILISILLSIILVLLVLLIFSNLNGLYTIVRIPYIEKRIATMNNEYSKASQRLIEIKEEVKNLEETKVNSDKNLVLYQSVQNLNGIKINISQRLRTSLDKRGYLKENGDYIFVNEFGNITLLDYFLFTGNESSDFNVGVNEGINLLSIELENILEDETLSKFIKYISIESYVDPNEVTEANKLLANQRAFKFLNALLDANSNLKEYSNKFISSNCYDNIKLSNVKEGVSTSRIEITTYLDEAALEESLSKFIEVE